MFNIIFYLTQVHTLYSEKYSAIESFFDEIKYYTHPDSLRKDLKNFENRELIIIDYSSKKFDPIIFTKKLKSLYKDIEVILVMRNRKRAAEAYNVGADDYILKPLSLERLHKAVKNIKRRREQV